MWKHIIVLVCGLCFCLAIHGGCTVTTGEEITLDAVQLRVLAAAPNPFKESLTLAYRISGANADSVVIQFRPAGDHQSFRYVFPTSDSLTLSSFRSSSYPTSIGYSEFVWDAAYLKPTLANGTYTYTITIVKNAKEQSVSGTLSKVSD